MADARARNAPRRDSPPRHTPPRRGRGTPGGRASASDAPPAWPSLGLALLAFVGYAAGAGTVSADKDSSEFTLVLASLGVAHPTGYPLHTLLGHVFVRAMQALGAGSAQAAALWSAFAGAAAVGLLHALCSRWLIARGVPQPRAWIVAFLPPLLFGLNPVWTLEATVAEVGAFHVAWLALAVLLADVTMKRPGGMSVRRAALTGVALGAGLAHHLSSVLWLGPLVAVLWPRMASGGARANGAFVAGLAALPLAGVAFVSLRAWHPAAIQWPLLEPSFASVWDHVSGAQYRHYLGRFAPSASQASLFMRFVLPLLPLALAGLVLASFQGARPARSPIARALLLSGVAQTLFALAYGVPDPVSYFLPVLAIGLASVPGGVLAWSTAARHAGPLKAIAAVAIAVLLPAWLGLASERRATFARFDALVRSMWERIPDEPGFVLWGDDMSHKLREYQLFDGRGRALTVVDPVLLAHRVARERFAREHGVEAFYGAALPALPDPVATAAFTDSVARRLNAVTPLPVYVFDPAQPSVRRLMKPGSVTAPSGTADPAPRP